MAKIKYTGPVDPMRIDGIGLIGKDWTPCPNDLAREFEKITGFEVQLDSTVSNPLTSEGEGGVSGGSKSALRNPKSAIESPGGDK